MAAQMTFKRYELKYLITGPQKQRLLAAMETYMAPDEYGKTLISNLYYDTANYRLIRHSIEKPVFKEKLRLRCYGTVTPDTKVFVELKRKCKKVVYKRRLHLSQSQAFQWLRGDIRQKPDSQIGNELQYFLEFYGDLQPRLYLSYERQAYIGRQDPALRITFDENILCRTEDLTLTGRPYGTALLPPDHVLMEIKTTQGMPLWLTHVLSQEKLYKTSFSKYGTAYATTIFPKLKEDHQYV